MAGYFDLHCDTLTARETPRVAPREEPFAKRGQIFACCAEGSRKPDLSWLDARIELLHKMPGVRLCRSARELERTIREGETAALLGVEGAEGIGLDAADLDAAYRRGVRVIGPVWNVYYGIAGSCTDREDVGLTDAGRRYLDRAEALGMLIDVSHCSDRAAADILARGYSRVCATHSNARACCAVPRNLPDALLAQLLDAGGVCGINLYTPFLSARESVGMDDVLRHIDDMLNRYPRAAAQLAFGCDFDGCDRLPDGIERAADMQVLYDRCAAVYGCAWTEDLFFNNAYRFLCRALSDEHITETENN